MQSINIERRIKALEQRTGAGQPQVVWVNPGETLRQSCERQGIEYKDPAIVGTGIDPMIFVSWKK
jgi:hypothetical protein